MLLTSCPECHSALHVCGVWKWIWHSLLQNQWNSFMQVSRRTWLACEHHYKHLDTGKAKHSQCNTHHDLLLGQGTSAVSNWKHREQNLLPKTVQMLCFCKTFPTFSTRKVLRFLCSAKWVKYLMEECVYSTGHIEWFSPRITQCFISLTWIQGPGIKNQVTKLCYLFSEWHNCDKWGCEVEKGTEQLWENDDTLSLLARDISVAGHTLPE